MSELDALRTKNKHTTGAGHADTPACDDNCRHQCPECRLGLGSHLTCDPRCDHRLTASTSGAVPSGEDAQGRNHGHRARLKRSLRRLSDRITQETSLEDIAREIAVLHERAQGYVAQHAAEDVAQ